MSEPAGDGAGAGAVLTGLFDVRNQVALVTGGASGLGYAFAEILAACGAVVVVADWNAERLALAASSLALTAGAPVHAAQVDVSDAAAVDALVDSIVADHGSIDIAFANAGVARGRPPLLPEGTIDEFDVADYHALIDVNLHGVVHTARAAARHMKQRRSGSIVVTASTAGLRNDPFTPYSYAIAKAAVVNFTKQAAHDLARWNVRVNTIAPGRSRRTWAAAGRCPRRSRPAGMPSCRSAGWATRRRSGASPCCSPRRRQAS